MTQYLLPRNTYIKRCVWDKGKWEILRVTKEARYGDDDVLSESSTQIVFSVPDKTYPLLLVEKASLLIKVDE